jgi:hypothetical protein
MANEVMLAEYDKACRQLARARSAREIEEIRGIAIIMRTAAKVMKNKEFSADAWDLETRATRQLGKGLEDGKDERAKAGGDASARDASKPTLKQLGITNSLADRARKLARMPDAEFGRYIVDGRAEAKILTTIDGSPEYKNVGKKKKAKSTFDKWDKLLDAAREVVEDRSPGSIDRLATVIKENWR